jgi:hypothetical protein
LDGLIRYGLVMDRPAKASAQWSTCSTVNAGRSIDLGPGAQAQSHDGTGGLLSALAPDELHAILSV